MTTFVATYIGKQVVSTLGYNIIVTGITASVNNIGNIISMITRSSIPGDNQIVEYLIESDIDATLRVIDEFLREIKPDHISNSLSTCLFNMKDITEKINMELSIMYNELDYNRSIILLKTWKAYDCSAHIAKLKVYSAILDKRYKMLVKILSVNDKLVPDDSQKTVVSDDDMTKSAIFVDHFSQSEKSDKLVPYHDKKD